MSYDYLIMLLIEWAIGEIILKNCWEKLEKVLLGDDFKRLGKKTIDEIIKENPDYIRVLNHLREIGNIEELEGIKLKKEDILNLFPEDKKICNNFLDALNQRYEQNILKEIRKDPINHYLLNRINENTISIEEQNINISTHQNEINEIKTKFDQPVSFQEKLVEKSHLTDYQLQINHSWDLITNNNPIQAINYLKEFKKGIWGTCDKIVKYEILRNMGAAEYLLGHEKKAGKLFIEALQYNPEDEKAICNAALGNLLLQNSKKAEELAKTVIEKNPANTKAYSIKIQSSKEKNFEEIVSIVPDFLKTDSEISYALSNVARKNGKIVESRKWLEIAVQNDEDNWIDIKGTLGERILEIVMMNPLLIYGIQITGQEKDEIRKAIELLTEAWDTVDNTDLKHVKSTWIANRGIAKKLIRDIPGAINDIDMALSLDSDPIYKKYRALLASEMNDTERAINLLEEIKSTEQIPEAPILLARVLHQDNQTKKAIDMLELFLKSEPPQILSEVAHFTLIQIYMDTEQYEEAQAVSENMLQSAPRNVLYLAILAKILRLQKRNKEAISICNGASGYIVESTPIDHLYELSDQFYYLQQYEEVINICEKIVDCDSDTPLIRKFLIALHESGKIGKALEICQNLTCKYGSIDFFLEMKAAIYEEIGDLIEAKKVYEEYLNIKKDNMLIKLRLAFLNYRINEIEAIDTFLKSEIDLNALSLEDGQKLALLYVARNQDQRAFEIMYEMRKKYFNDSKAHLLYFHFFTAKEKENKEWLHVSRAAIDTAVCVENPSQNKEWYIIVDINDPDIKLREFKKDHTLAQKLMGRKVGDEFILYENPYSTEKVKIIEIQSKYVYANQEIMNSYNNLFPDETDFIRIPLSRSGKENGEPLLFEIIKTNIENEKDRHEQICKLYREENITMGGFSNFLGKNILDLWGYCVNNSDIGVRCCRGTLEEKNHALLLLVDRPRLITDIISLMTLHKLKIGDVIIKEFGKLGIAQSTVDLLQQLIWDQGAYSGGYMIIGKEENNLVRQMISSDDVERNVVFLKDVLQWIRNNGEIISCRAALNISRKEREELDRIFGKSFSDTLLIAGEPGNLLYSDDIVLRGFARNDKKFNDYFKDIEFSVDGIWTQIILLHCLANNLLSRDEYYKKIVILASSHYYFTSIDANILFEAANQSNWLPSHPFTTVAQILRGKSSDEISAMTIGVDFFIKLLYLEERPDSIDLFILHFLNLLIEERNSDFLKKLEMCLRSRLSLRGINGKRILFLFDLFRKMNYE